MYWKLHFRITYNPNTSTTPPDVSVCIVATETPPSNGGDGSVTSEGHAACGRISSELQNLIQRELSHIRDSKMGLPIVELITCDPLLPIWR